MTVKVPCNDGLDLFEMRMVREQGRDELHLGRLVFLCVSAR